MNNHFHKFGLPGSTKETSKMILGGKGAGLVWMSQNGISVPPGFTISTDAWREYKKSPHDAMHKIAGTLPEYLEALKEHFGYMPLLSVRSGAPESCPGMMDTILNVGIDGSSETFWMEKLGIKCFMDSYHRLVMMYGSVVDGLDRHEIEKVGPEAALDYYQKHSGHSFPAFTAQLLGSIEAVFQSWDNDRAKVYRKLNGIPDEIGTAVNIQAMVFGNLNDNSGTGVLFTRDCDTGLNGIKGEFLINAQGEDVVAGIRTPIPMSKMAEWRPAVAQELMSTVLKLEQLKRDVQDVEFTIQDGKLYLLQTRNAKRTANAAIKIALDMVQENLITPAEAVKRVTVRQLDTAMQPQIAKNFTNKPKFTGISACSGVVSGRPVFTSKAAVNAKDKVILITEETTPEDIAGMHAAQGVITMTGGLTSHAAVVARGMDKPCIVGLGKKMSEFEGETIVSMDGATGRIWLEPVPTVGGDGNVDVARFNSLVLQVLEAIPALAHMPVAGTQLDAALYFAGHQVLTPVELVNKVKALLNWVKTLYLDVTQTVNPVYQGFMQNFGDPAEHVAKFVELLDASVTDKSRIVLIGAAKSIKFKSVGSTVDLRSLILADSEVMVEGDMKDPAIKKVLAWKKAEGVSMVTLGSKLEGSKAFISPEQALQLVAK